MATSDPPLATQALADGQQKPASESSELQLDDLLRKQKDLLQSIERFAAEKNPSAELLARMSKEAQQRAEELQDLANRYTAQEQTKGVASRHGRTQVMLTPLQRMLIYGQTGVDIEVLVIEDMTGSISASMPMTDPHTIGRLALAEAQRRQARAVAEAEAKKKLQDAIAQIESQGSADVRAQLNKLKHDPSFLGGALNK